jgi:predicted ribonuclease YlaK
LEQRDKDDLTLVVPLIVIDELDNLKRTGTKEVRPRARGALKLIDGFFATRNDRLTIAVPTIDHGGVSVRLLLDPPRHVRLPHADSELIDRAAPIDLVDHISNPVIFVTGDTGAVIRARNAKVNVVKLKFDD